MTILLTGASGFIGQAILNEARNRSLNVRSVYRKMKPAFVDHGEDVVVMESFDHETDWAHYLHGVDVIIHCAARVHVMQEELTNPFIEYRRVNVQSTINLARHAAAFGVKRFIFISSIKVNGESTELGSPFSVSDIPAPVDDFARSKEEAEVLLRLLSVETGIDVVIIRSPLVYGPGVKGNFSSLMKWSTCGMPLPFGAVKSNLRSLVAIDNLVDLIIICTAHPNAENKTLFVSDGEDLSTVELFNRISKAVGRPIYLIPVPVSFLRFVLKLFGKNSIAKNLLGTLQLDISNTCELLDWKPQVSIDEVLTRML